MIDQAWVQENLARCVARIEVLKLMTWKQASNIEKDVMDPSESSTVKVFGSENFVSIYQWLLEILGPESLVKAGSPAAILGGRLERYYRTALVLTFGGGVNEVQRDLIALFGLGLPRIPRH